MGNTIVLINNDYEEKNGNVISSTYGNTHIVSFDYDEFNRMTLLNKMNNIYKYKYDNNGNLVKIISNNSVKRFTYDIAKKLHKYELDNFKIFYSYDKNNNICNKKYVINDIANVIENEYNAEDYITKTLFNDNELQYEYDILGRIIRRKINENFTTQYSYVSNGDRTTLLPKEMNNNGDIYSYKYDKLNNITHIYHNGNLEMRYYYDSNNQLIAEDNYLNKTTIRYSYDNQGNMLAEKTYELKTFNLISINTYEYGDLSWEDKLTKFNNNQITYDQIGNPISIGTEIQLEWINGRELDKYQNNDLIVNYSYNENSIRTSKKINNVETKYFLEGNKIVLEKTGNNVLYYIRNELNDLIGINYNNDLYYFLKNAQDDVIGLLDENLNIVARYTYDSWGNIISIKDENGNDISMLNNHIANINPFRYKSYYYDKETGLYYLNQRYYNPRWKRFLNADVQLNSDILGNNLFVYCGNNPIKRKDENGTGWWVVAGAFTGLVFGITTKVVSNVAKGKKWNEGVIGAAVGGAVGGALAALGYPIVGTFVGAGVEAATNEALSYTDWSKYNGQKKKEMSSENIVDSIETITTDTVVNGFIAVATGKIAGEAIYINTKSWIKPKKISTSFIGKYALKNYGQYTIQSIYTINFDLISYTYDVNSEDFQNKIHQIFPCFD